MAACKTYPLEHRKLKRWEVTNRPLYDAIVAEACRPKDIAEIMGVSERTVQKWIFQDARPEPQRRRQLSELLGRPEDELFRNT